MTAHAVLSASSSERWINCPPSACINASLPDTQSVFAAEGTLAHEIGEIQLRQLNGEIGKTEMNARLRTLKKNELYETEMLRYVDVYADYVKEVLMTLGAGAHMSVEKKLDYSSYAPKGFGTGDCVLLGGENELHVIDLKYGKGVAVDAYDNSQLKLYGLGALNEYRDFYDVDVIVLHIVQPRKESISTFRITAEELEAWGENVVRPIAKLAAAGEGEFVAGEHCRFCGIKGSCQARANQMMTDAESAGRIASASMNEQEIGKALETAKQFALWAKDVEEEAEKRLFDGREVKGWKLVAGRKTRTFSDVDIAFDRVIGSGIDRAALYEQKPIAFTKIESLLGKKEFESLLGDLVIRSEGKPTLARESDKRVAISGSPSVEETFSDIDVGA